MIIASIFAFISVFGQMQEIAANQFSTFFMLLCFCSDFDPCELSFPHFLILCLAVQCGVFLT